MAIVVVLSSAGTFTALEGAVTNTQWKEIIGVAAIFASVAAVGIKEYLGALGSPVPSPQLNAAIEKYLSDKGITFPK